MWVYVGLCGVVWVYVDLSLCVNMDVCDFMLIYVGSCVFCGFTI